MGEKPVTDLAGVGETLGKRLETAGFDKVTLIIVVLDLSCSLIIPFIKFSGVHRSWTVPDPKERL